MDFREKITLGRTGLSAGRLGISSSFGAPAAAFEGAFERGCNYFTWGTFIKGRSAGMKQAIHNIIEKGERDNLILAMFTYAHNSYLTELFLKRGLRALGIDYADILLLGYFPKRPGQRVIDGAIKLKEKGLVRFLGISSHNRALFPEINKEGIFDVFHVRYNVAHRGAETETFPFLDKNDRPGIVAFTATRWGQLMKSKKMPEGETPPSAADCYRFVLSNSSVDVCMMGAKDTNQMRENLLALEKGPMSNEEISRMIKIGDHVYPVNKSPIADRDT
jgi:predicted aldo/keto reductase-like oxidoreductase